MYTQTYVPVTMLILRAQYSKGGQAVNGGGLLSQVEEITFTATHLRTVHTLHFEGSGASLSNEGSRGVGSGSRCVHNGADAVRPAKLGAYAWRLHGW